MSELREAFGYPDLAAHKRSLDHREAAEVWFRHALEADAAGAPRSASDLLGIAADHERAAHEGCDPVRCFVYHPLFCGD